MWANVWQEKQWPGFDIKLVKVNETLLHPTHCYSS